MGQGSTEATSPSPVGPPPASRWSSRRLVVGLAASLLFLLGTGIIGVRIFRNYVNLALKAKLSELGENVNAIRTAELSHHASEGRFVSVELHPRELAALDQRGVPWPVGSGFDDLGWDPDGPVRAAYSVEVSPDGTDFVVHGWADVDDDGVRAHYTATRSISAARITDRDIR